MTRTLAEAIHARIEEAREAARARAEEEARRQAEIDEHEQHVARYFNAYICKRYDLEPGALNFKAAYTLGGTFELQAAVGEGYIALVNPVVILEGDVHIQNLPVAGHHWNAWHKNGHPDRYTDLMSAACHALHGCPPGAIECEEVDHAEE